MTISDDCMAFSSRAQALSKRVGVVKQEVETLRKDAGDLACEVSAYIRRMSKEYPDIIDPFLPALKDFEQALLNLVDTSLSN